LIPEFKSQKGSQLAGIVLSSQKMLIYDLFHELGIKEAPFRGRLAQES
jgi:hypothetical protein